MQDILVRSYHGRLLRAVAGVCPLLRPLEVGKKYATETAIMLAFSALTMIYLFYALLRPEKF